MVGNNEVMWCYSFEIRVVSFKMLSFLGIFMWFNARKKKHRSELSLLLHYFSSVPLIWFSFSSMRYLTFEPVQSMQLCSAIILDSHSNFDHEPNFFINPSKNVTIFLDLVFFLQNLQAKHFQLSFSELKKNTIFLSFPIKVSCTFD